MKDEAGEGVVHIPHVHGGENQLVRAWIDLCYGSGYMELLHRAAEMDADDSDAPALIEKLSSIAGGARILCALRHTEDGSAKVNQRFMKLFMQRGRVIRFGEWFSGLPLMVTRNDHIRELFNGETGLLLRFRTGFRWISARASEIRSLPPEALPECEPAFATTIHKSQGSEYDRTLIWLPEDDHPLLSRQILYTALTRARRTVWIYGKDAVLRAAIERTQKRETGGLSPRI